MGLSYPVENESVLARAVRKAWKVSGRLRYDFARPEGKPAWMRWRTFLRREEEAEAAERAIAMYEGRFEELLRKVDAMPVLRARRGSKSRAFRAES